MNQEDDKACAPCTQASTQAETGAEGHSLRRCVQITLHNYFAQLDDQMVSGVYEMVLAEVEAPMLEAVLRHTRGNQTIAAEVLGLNRGTLRKKLKRYGML